MTPAALRAFSTARLNAARDQPPGSHRTVALLAAAMYRAAELGGLVPVLNAGWPGPDEAAPEEPLLND